AILMDRKRSIKRIRLHDLRHSHASLLIELGFTPLLISQRLGHENVETTLNIYSHLYPNKDMIIYTVTGYVDAENSFSAKIRNNFIVKMECTKDLSKYRVLDVNITE
ncbi:hypothetical protein CLQ_01436, partial [Clostridium botulinum Af84]|uniref:tyrosine-type recombinase/integrase n=1 Tax=Clostridium botulinum TaxID=1491 RepID=UPI00035BA754